MKLFLLCLVSFSAFFLSANTRILEFRSANRLLERRQYAKAAAAFEALAKKSKGAQLTYALRRQCETMARIRKGKEALKIAAKISDPAVREFTVLQILSITRQSRQIVAQFGKKDLMKLPDDLVHHALYMRAEALGSLKRYDAAFKDIDNCLAHCGSDIDQKMHAWMYGAYLANAAKKYDLALKYADPALKQTRFRGGYMFLRPMMIKTQILLARKDIAGAEKCLALAPKNMGKGKGYWGCHFNILAGDVALAKGNKSQAAAFYRNALVSAGNAKSLKSAVQKKLASVK